MRKKIYGVSERQELATLKTIREIEDKKQAFEKCQLDQAYAAILENPLAAHASDYVQEMPGGILLVYTCPECEWAPTQMKDWTRCVTKHVAEQKDEKGIN